jgi:hypothetical protein
MVDDIYMQHIFFLKMFIYIFIFALKKERMKKKNMLKLLHNYTYF